MSAVGVEWHTSSILKCLGLKGHREQKTLYLLTPNLRSFPNSLESPFLESPISVVLSFVREDYLNRTSVEWS